jgi:hypothetical protein
MFDSQTYLYCETCGEYVNESEAEAHENSCESRQASHTPGPWVITMTGEESPTPCGIRSESTATGQICYIPPQHESGAANARLIAAAPELLAALRTIQHDWDTGTDAKSRHAHVVRAAITRAQGDHNQTQK